MQLLRRVSMNASVVDTPRVSTAADAVEPSSVNTEQVDCSTIHQSRRPSTESWEQRQPRVRWRTNSTNDSDDEFYDARASFSRSRSRSRTSTSGRSTSRDARASSPPNNNKDDGAKNTPTRKPTGADGGSGGDDSGDKEKSRKGRQPPPSPQRSQSSTDVKTRKWMKPDKFNGTGSVETFLAQFDICANYNSWTDQDKTAYLKVLHFRHCRSADLGQWNTWSDVIPRTQRQTATEIWI